MSHPTPTRYAADSRQTEESARRLQTGLRAGLLERVRRGAYVDAATWSAENERQRHERIAIAFLRAARTRVIFAQETAAVLLGMPVLGRLPDRPVVAVAPGKATSDAGAIRRELRLEEDEIVRQRGISLTSPLRTAVDVGAARGPDAAIAVVSDALRRWGLTAERIGEHVDRRRPFRGVRAIDLVLPIASALLETPLESVALWRIVQLGFELPELQIRIVVDGRGYRVDYYWRGADVIGEADGRLKYDDPDAAWAEKVREDDLRSVSRGFVRIYWSDLHDLRRLERKLLRAGVPRAR